MRKLILTLFLMSGIWSLAHAATLSNGIVGKSHSVGEFIGQRIVKTDTNTWYAFVYTIGDTTLWYLKSTDSGRTWAPAVLVASEANITRIAVWFDKWTPGDSGTIIHIAYIDPTDDDVLYNTLDTASDTVGSPVAVFAGGTATTTASASEELDIIKTEGGTLCVLFDMDAGTETDMYCDASAPFATFVDRATPFEGVSDYIKCVPGNYADTNDFDCSFIDRSADEWTRKTYDDSGDSWSESTALVAGAGFVEGTTVFPQHSVALDISTATHWMFGWNCYDGAGCDLQGFKWDGTTQTATTNVVTNSDDAGMVAASYDEATSTLYVFYGGKSDGTETIGSAIKLYYKTSTNDGVTWGDEQTLYGTADDFRSLYTAPNISAVLGSVPVAWFNDDTNEITATADNPSGSSSNIIGLVS